MKVTVRTARLRLSLPVPLGLAGFAVRVVPEKLLQEMRSGVPAPYGNLLTRECVAMLLDACLDVLREYKGLELVHVETTDGTLVHVVL